MFDYLLAHFFSLVFTFTILLLTALALRLLILGVVLVFTGQARFMSLLPRLQSPLDFIVGLLHGSMSLWSSIAIFNWFDQKINLSLALFLLICFLWYDFNRLRRLPKQTQNLMEDKRQNMVIRRLDEDFNNLGQNDNPFRQMLQERQQALQEKMRSGTVIQLIGRCVGLILAATNSLPWTF